MCQVELCNKPIVAKELCQPHYDRLRRYGDLQLRPAELTCQTCKTIFKPRKTGNVAKFCDECAIENHRSRMRADRRRKGLWEHYKLTLDEYQAMHDAQNGLCLICNKKTSGRGKKNNQLAVDHCHQTGHIRGLLCNKCNTAIGLFNDNIELLKNAQNYLQER